MGVAVPQDGLPLLLLALGIHQQIAGQFAEPFLGITRKRAPSFLGNVFIDPGMAVLVGAGRFQLGRSQSAHQADFMLDLIVICQHAEIAEDVGALKVVAGHFE